MKKNKNRSKKISRKEAVKKISFTTFTAGTMLFLLNNPAKGQYESPTIPEDFDW